MEEKSEFTWVNTHKEIVLWLAKMKDHQLDLISELEKAGVGGFFDRDAQGQTIKLDEMEPFSFFFYIYKYGELKRLQILQNIARNLNLSIPLDADGIPSANPLSVRVFPQKEIRIHDEVNRLWSFFFKAIEHKLTHDDFHDILTIVSMGKAKLTEGLFMVDPDYYLCINGQTRPYLKEVMGIDLDLKSYQDYMNILKKFVKKPKCLLLKSLMWLGDGTPR